MNTKLNKLRRIVKSYVFAPSRSPKGEHFRLFLSSVAGLFLGIVMALLIQTHYAEVERVEALQKELLQSATPPPGQGEKRWLALEQLKLLMK